MSEEIMGSIHYHLSMLGKRESAFRFIMSELAEKSGRSSSLKPDARAGATRSIMPGTE